jgi:predicted nucleic acid-binding protein
MASERYVVDASVAAKWFLDDEHLIQEATAYLVRPLSDEIEMHAPVLLRYEFGNILSKAQRDDGRPINDDRSLEALELFLEYPILYHDLASARMLIALRSANQYRSSFQDASYLSLAMFLGCRLLTADTKFVERLPPDIVQRHVQNLC